MLQVQKEERVCSSHRCQAQEDALSLLEVPNLPGVVLGGGRVGGGLQPAGLLVPLQGLLLLVFPSDLSRLWALSLIYFLGRNQERAPSACTKPFGDG